MSHFRKWRIRVNLGMSGIEQKHMWKDGLAPIEDPRL